jgi:hypothetical protein
MNHISKFIAMLLLSLAIAPATAFAQGGTSVDPYENEGPQVQERIDQGSNPTDEEDSGSTPVAAAAEDQGGGGGELPFTGLDVALVIGAGALLLGLGVGMRRLTRPSREAA